MNPKITTIALSACFVMGSTTVVPAFASGTEITAPSGSTLFTDISGHWASPTIESLAMLGIVNGSDGLVRPNDSISRAEFVKLLLVATDIPITGQGSMSFVDVPQSHWAHDIIATAASLGIVNGMDDQHFAPDAPVTREQLAKLLTANSKSLAKETTSPPTFSDINGSWAYSYIVNAYQSGLIKGLDGNRFAPGNNATRAEAFVMMERMLNKETKSTNLPSDDTLVSRVNPVVQTIQQSNGGVPTGFSNNFIGPWKSMMQKVETGAGSLPNSGLPTRGFNILSSNVMTRAEHCATVKVISASGSTEDAQTTYEFLEVHLIKKDGQWKIGYFVPVGQ